jgi:hypothetical protein
MLPFRIESQYFGSISYIKQIVQSNNVVIDVHEPFKKMSNRNRTMIVSAQGPLLLTVPLQEGRDQKKSMKDVQICYKQNWTIKHLKAISSCYKRSPFFEYYEPSLQALLLKKHQYLVDLNMSLVQWLEKQLKMSFNISQTNEFIPFLDPNYKDVRDLSNLDSTTQNLVNQVYPQVFMDKIDFISNASILDLLFCMGPTSIIYLKDSDL